MNIQVKDLIIKGTMKPSKNYMSAGGQNYS